VVVVVDRIAEEMRSGAWTEHQRPANATICDVPPLTE
jgi:hypothetical protein